MNFLNLAETRYSVRNFQDKQISESDLNKILTAAQLSPTAKNRQEQRLLVVNEKSTLEKLRETTLCHFNAPTIIVLCYEKTFTESGLETEDSQKWSHVDLGIVATHICLEATDLGLGSIMVGLFDKEKLIHNLNIPSNYEPVLLLPIGYIDKKPSHLHNDRLPLSQTVFYNKY